MGIAMPMGVIPLQYRWYTLVPPSDHRRCGDDRKRIPRKSLFAHWTPEPKNENIQHRTSSARYFRSHWMLGVRYWLLDVSRVHGECRYQIDTPPWPGRGWLRFARFERAYRLVSFASPSLNWDWSAAIIRSRPASRSCAVCMARASSSLVRCSSFAWFSSSPHNRSSLRARRAA